jgi:hypothetical protein
VTTQKTKPTATAASGAASPAGPLEEAVDRLAGLLPADELEDALKGLEPEQITGTGGLLSQLAGRVIETALGAELTEHLGYAPGQAPPGGAGNPQRLVAEDGADRAGASGDQDAPRQGRDVQP